MPKILEFSDSLALIMVDMIPNVPKKGIEKNEFLNKIISWT